MAISGRGLLLAFSSWNSTASTSRPARQTPPKPSWLWHLARLTKLLSPYGCGRTRNLSGAVNPVGSSASLSRLRRQLEHSAGSVPAQGGRAVEVACAIQNQAAIRGTSVLAVETIENLLFVADGAGH